MRILEIPVDPQAQREWLEDQLLEPDITSLIVELEAVAKTHSATSTVPCGEDNETRTIHKAFAGEQSDWIRNGLGSMSDDAWRKLVNHPHLLFELQEQIFIENSDYWKPKIDAVARRRHAVLTAIPVTDARAIRKLRWVLLALAASICALVVGSQVYNAKTGPTIASSAWGWNESVASRTFSTPEEYLTWISQGANAWFNKDPQSVDEFRQRLDELRAGCQRLIDGEHDELPAATRLFLVARCKEWKAKFDVTAKQLRDSPDQFVELKKRTDQSVRNAIVVLDQMTL